MKLLFLTALIVLLSACTSLEDFQHMSADERAQKVCEGSSSYGTRARSLRQLNDQIAEKEELLARGYRVHEHCQIMTIAVPDSTVECANASGEALKACQRGESPTTTVRQNVCTETPVPIDYNYESSSLRDIRMTRDGLLEQHEQSTYTCEARVRALPADRAYLLYEADME